jgi:CelD/BcsL family acetyltransferase involved in cellulose biosynthesis
VNHASLDVRRCETLEEIGPEAWDDLVSRCARASIFQGYGWNAAWWGTMRPERSRAVVIAARRAGRLVGVAPLFFAGRQRDGDAPIRFIGHGNADYLDFLVDGSVPGTTEALFTAILRIDDPWTVFEAVEMPEWSRLRQGIERGHVSAMRPRLVAQTPCPGATIEGRRDEFAALARKKSLRRHASALAKEGAVAVQHLTEGDAILAALDGFFDQHVARWEGTPYPSLFREERCREFYRAMTRALAPRGEVVLTVLRAGDRAVAHHFGLLQDRRFIWYKPSFDPALARCSPGEVLLQELIRYCTERDCVELDFTRGDEPFKHRFADHVGVNNSYVWRRRRAALLQRGAHGLRRVLGVARGWFRRPHCF